MEGPQTDPGINFRTMQELFRVIDTERRASHKHQISASIIEIYNEQVRTQHTSACTTAVTLASVVCDHEGTTLARRHGSHKIVLFALSACLGKVCADALTAS